MKSKNIVSQFTNDQEIEFVDETFKKSGIDTIKKIDIPKLEDPKSKFTDIDILGIYKNVIIIVECVGREGLGKKVKDFKSESEKIIKNFDIMLVGVIKKNYSRFFKKHKKLFEDKKDLIIKKLLIAGNREKIDVKERNGLEKDDLYIWDRDNLEYFKIISDCAYDHCKFEIFDLLRIEPSNISNKKETSIPCYIAIGEEIKKCTYILNFLVPINILLERSFVYRFHGGDPELGFQRLLNKQKLKKMRDYLLEGKTYPNNVIAILNVNTTLHNTRGDLRIEGELETVLKKEGKKIFLVSVPDTYKVFYIVDGQHRIFSFAQTHYEKYEKANAQEKRRLKKGDKKIQEIAEDSQLPVTAILFKGGNNIFKGDFAMRLFYEINTTQTKIDPEDVIDLTEKLDKDSPVAKANKLLRQLNKNGVLRNRIRIKFWQDNRIKRTSLINYAGLKKIFDNDSNFYSLYKKQTKIKDFIDFCFILINNYLASLRNLAKQKHKKNPAIFKKIEQDISLKEYYLFSAVFIGASIRLLRHFISDEDKTFKVSKKINQVLENKIELNIDNVKIQNLFEEGLKIIIDNYDFNKKEFEKKGYASNRWAKIEADLFSSIKRKKKGFGDINLISRKYR